MRSAGVADWITAAGGGHGAYAHCLGAPPLLATPIATPLQGGRPERPGPLFVKLPKWHVFPKMTQMTKRPGFLE